MEPEELMEKVDDAAERKSALNTWVAATVAILAVFMGVCSVKDGNVVQAMQQAQASSVDDWSWYQAKKTRIEVAESSLGQIKLMPASQRQAQAVTQTEAYLAKEKKELDDTKKKAEGDQKTYDDWNYHDDQFDLAEGALSVAIALLAVTSLTQKRWLFFIALVPTVFGVVMGLAGLLGWNIHPDALAKLLGT